MFNFSNSSMISPSKSFKPAPFGLPHSEAAAAAAAAAMQGSGIGMINYPPMFAAGEHALAAMSHNALQPSYCYTIVMTVL